MIINELVNNCNGCKDTGTCNVKRGSITSTTETKSVRQHFLIFGGCIAQVCQRDRQMVQRVKVVHVR